MADISPLIETLENRWMRAWVGGDLRTLKSLTARNFRLVVGSKPSVLLDAKSWLEAANSSFVCHSYRFGDVYARDLGPVTVFATQIDLKASIDGHDWSGPVWVTDIWKKSGVRRRWRMVERVFSRPEEDKHLPPAIRSLQLWRKRSERLDRASIARALEYSDQDRLNS
jgi:Domain of unknown function (DUF4440)